MILLGQNTILFHMGDSQLFLDTHESGHETPPLVTLGGTADSEPLGLGLESQKSLSTAQDFIDDFCPFARNTSGMQRVRVKKEPRSAVAMFLFSAFHLQGNTW